MFPIKLIIFALIVYLALMYAYSLRWKMKEIWTVLTSPFYVLWAVCGPIIGFLIALIKLLYRLIAGHKEAPKHGDSDWASLSYLKSKGHLTPKGFYIGRYPKGDVPIFCNPEKGVLVIAAPGTGKSQSIIASMHAIKALPEHERPTIIISDAANEVYRHTSALFAEMGYVVGKIDLESPKEGAKYDILSVIRTASSSDMDKDITDLTELLVPNNPGEKNSHFRDFARQMLSEAILLNVKYEGNNKTIGEITDELANEDLRDEMIKRMKGHGSKFVVVETFKKLGSNEGPSMLSTSLNKLKIWRSESVREVSTFGVDENGKPSRGWKWEDVIMFDKPTVMFVRVGLSGGPAGGEFTRVVLGNAVNTLTRMYDRSNQPFPRPIRIIADEAMDMGHCTAISKAFRTLRKARVNIMMCFLSKKDLDATYKEDADTLWNGCDHVVFGGCNDLATNELYSRLIGDWTIQNHSVNIGSHGESRGASEMGVKLIRPEQIMRLPNEECILLLEGVPVKAKKAYRFTKNGVKYY